MCFLGKPEAGQRRERNLAEKASNVRTRERECGRFCQKRRVGW